MGMVYCAMCGHKVSSQAAACPKCGHPLKRVGTQQVIVQGPAWHPGLAAVFSLFIPGAGQLYKGSILGFLLWIVIVPIGYMMLVLPGLVLHLICIISAASGDPYKKPPNASRLNR